MQGSMKRNMKFTLKLMSNEHTSHAGFYMHNSAFTELCIELDVKRAELLEWV